MNINESVPMLKKELKSESMRVCKKKKIQFNKKTKPYKSCKNRKKKRRRPRNRPYSAKNFLGRPKINAPANTTQFLCADKEYYSENHKFGLVSSTNGSTSFSDSESSHNTSLNTITPAYLQESSAINTYESSLFDDDSFFTEEFDQMYDTIQTELLRNESIDNLTARCMELESAVYNLRYLLQKETEKRKHIEELIYLLEFNKKLLHENNHLLQSQAMQTFDESNISFNLHGISIDKTDVNES